MKRYGNLWQKVCDRANIEQAADNAIKGKPLTKERQKFIGNRKELLDQLEVSLLNETYQFSFLKYFTVYEPKERKIHHSPFYPRQDFTPLRDECSTAVIYGENDS